MDINNEIENLINELDKFGASQTSRLKVNFSDDVIEGSKEVIHHHGRCDIGSPWARGCAFDVLEEDTNV